MEKNENLFPDAPLRCTFEDCHMPVKMKKHGFYRRYVIANEFSGYVYIRRYICPCCGRTVSFLPSFLIPYFQYALPYILWFLDGYYKGGGSLRKYVVNWLKKRKDSFSRRHFRYYVNRIFSNRSLIQYYLNLAGQGIVLNEDALNSRLFVKNFLEKVHAVSPHYLSWNFFNLTGKSILTPIPRIS